MMLSVQNFYPAMVLTFIGVLANIFTLGKDIFPLVAPFFGKLHNFKPQAF